MAIHSDMQGPCPDGFHIMTKDELTELNTAWNYFVNTSSGMVSAGDFYKYLKMPLSGARNGSGTINSVGSGGMYWTSSAYSTTGAYRLYITASSVDSTGSGNRANGFSIRPVKDEAVAPDNSRTILYAAAGLPESNNISRSSSLGLITITYTAYGNTYRRTISDKNLGATTVWNDGDTLTDANCGNFYQWGNNNGFAHSGTLTTSSTQVDTTGYKPGNYYSNNVYIVSNANWSSINNSNLWGGTSKGVWVDYSVYDRETGQTLVDDGYYSGNTTIGNILSNNLTPNYGITSISETLGGEPLGSSVLIKNTSGTFYDVSVTPGCHLEKDYSAMQGPTPDGFHVPSKDEWVALYGILTTTFSMAANATTMGTYLKMPMNGYRSYTSSAGYQGEDGRYWSSTRYDENKAFSLAFTSGNILPQNNSRRSFGFSVRCFKNSYIIPDASWTTLYDGSSIASGAGIFHNASLGLISVSGDGQTRYTIMDKNLGATTVYNNGDTLSEANCGKYYQWGNNYGFPRTGTISNQSTTQVDANNYGPGNYYLSDTFIKYDGRWDSTDNGNLRGGETGITYTEVCPTYKLHGHIGTWHMEWVPESYDYLAIQGPCPDGYHVPLKSEWENVVNIGISFGIRSSTDASNFVNYLKIPGCGFINYGTGRHNNGANGVYICADWHVLEFVNTSSTKRLVFDPVGLVYPGCGSSIRPFKNNPVEPDSSWTTIYDGSSVATGAGIFYNSTLGLISISGDGVNWITIADKNLGATTVYNDGDTKSETNCGKNYQWGNNYGFSRSGAESTSSTKIDASNYGPGNYYSSSTFITQMFWDSSYNDNLRGGETGVIPGYYQRRTGPARLKSYQEIVAMATAEDYPWTATLAELNRRGLDYYNKLNSEGHMVTTLGAGDVIDGIRRGGEGRSFYITYRNNNWEIKSVITTI